MAKKEDEIKDGPETPEIEVEKKKYILTGNVKFNKDELKAGSEIELTEEEAEEFVKKNLVKEK